MKIQASIACAALAVPIFLSGQNTQPPAHPGQNNSPQLSDHDHMFLHALASEDQSEIELARLALQKSTNPQIQQYARTKILAADPSMEQQAVQIAEQEHSHISTAPNPAAKADYANFAKLSGENFDKAYMHYEARQQAEDLKIVKNEITTASNQQLSDFARKEQAPVAQAAQSAEQIAQSMHVSP